MILMKITFSAYHVEDDIKKEFYPSRCRNQFFTICLLAFILCGNSWALGKHWLHREITTEKYFESQNAILAEVHDKESADLAAGKLNKLKWLPEYADLEPHTPALYDAFCDNTERERICKALFFGSTDLAKALCGEQYRFYLQKKKKLLRISIQQSPNACLQKWGIYQRAVRVLQLILRGKWTNLESCLRVASH